MEEQAVEANLVCCLINVVIFMELGGAYMLGLDVKVIIWEGSHKGIRSFFMRGFDTLGLHVKILIWQLKEG